MEVSNIINYTLIQSNYTDISFINYSILGGLLNIVLDIIGDKQKYLTNWSKESLMELYI